MNDATTTIGDGNFSAALNDMPLAMQRSMTSIQGREMAWHTKITQKTGATIYFFNPHDP